MAGGLLFVTQAVLDSWAGQGRIELTGNILTLLQGAGRGRSYALEPAVRFLKVLGAEQDPHNLLAKVKPISQLREMKAEQVANSVIVGDAAYEVEPGFLAEAAALQAVSAADQGEAALARPAPPPAALPPPAPAPAPPAAPAAAHLAHRPAPLPRELEEKRKEAEALARFLLENLF